MLQLLPAAQMLVFVASLCDMTTEQMEVAICSRMVSTQRPQRYARSIPVNGRHLGDIYSGKRFMRIGGPNGPSSSWPSQQLSSRA